VIRTTFEYVALGFEEVSTAFETNLTERAEVSAAFAAVKDGELVVDLWGGITDRSAGTPWKRDSVVVIFSGTKGMVALCLLMLADRGAREHTPATHWLSGVRPRRGYRSLQRHISEYKDQKEGHAKLSGVRP
jgi:CubicO group peptidase (beta-lactamase class C family)